MPISICHFKFVTKSFFTLTLLLLSVFVFAQKGKQKKESSLFYTIDFKSPQINKDSTVTFRYYAPNAKYVTVDGDFIKTGERPIKMVKDSAGLWSYTTPYTLTPELYAYTFGLDGERILDPNNIFILRNDTQYYNIFIYPSRNSDYTNLVNLYQAKDNKHGDIVTTWYKSSKFNMQRKVNIYLPNSYRDTIEYPILFLLHGMGGDEGSWLRFGRLGQIMDNMIARGDIPPMIVVMPNGNVDVDSAPGESAIGYDIPNPYLPNTMNGLFEESFGEIVSFVEQRYSTDKERYLLAGYSMGGLNAFAIAANMSDRFQYIALFSPALGFVNYHTTKVYDNAANSVLKLIKDKKYKLFWIGIGKEDFLLKNVLDYVDKLDKTGDIFIFNLSEGGHIWNNWRRYLVEFLKEYAER